MKSVTVPVLVKSLVCRRLVMIFRLRLVIASKGRLGVSFRVLSASIFETIHVLSVLRRARLSRNETAATMIAELVYEMAYTGSRAPEIEEARQAAWIEISALSASLREKLYAPPDMWNAALKSTERWKELLS